MTTAMDKWADQDDDRQNEGEGLEPEQQHSHEGEDYGTPEHDQVETSESTSLISDEEAAHEAKKAKDKKIMKMVGAGLGVFALVVVSLSFFSRDKSVQQYADGQQSEIVSPIAQPVNAPTAPVVDVPPLTQAQMQESVITEPPLAPISAPQGKVPESPIVPSITTGASQAPVPVGVQPNLVAQTPAGANDAAIIAGLRSENNTLRAELETQRALAKRLQADLDARMKASQNQNAAAPKPVTQAVNTVAKQLPIIKPAPVVAQQNKKAAESVKTKADVPKPEASNPVVEKQVLQETRQTPALPSAQNKGSKVRSEFTVYAVSNGRAWVTWSKDGLNYTVGVNSELPDYSKVTSIDDSTGVVFTSAGEIHPRPPTK